MHSNVFCLKPIDEKDPIYYVEENITDYIYYADYADEVNLLASYAFKDIEYNLNNKIFTLFRDSNRFLVKINKTAIKDYVDKKVSNLKEWLEKAGDDATDVVIATHSHIITDIFDDVLDNYIIFDCECLSFDKFLYHFYNNDNYDSESVFEVYQMFDIHF